ncbi:MAG: DNA recombination protein RmuC [Kiritimatiellae bacterium]|nr:DNA recombination protein RmuC [Kiritimatiellia bacterium]
MYGTATLIIVGAGAAVAAAVLVYALMRSALAAERASARAADRGVDALRSEFAALAAATLEGKAKALAESNAAQVKPLFDGIAQRFAELRQASEQAREANVRLGESLKVKLDEVGLRAQSLGRQADEFVAALRGGSKVQGNWGEGILAKVLEDAGLVRGEHFVEQTGARDAGLPDVTVFVGAHRRILIDAKVNITDFISAVNAARAGDEAASAAFMKDHAKRVRAQIDGLAARRYPELMKRGDADPEAVYSGVVIMFMPSEATYFAAVNADPTLIEHANSKRVVLATPQMLFGYLLLMKMGIDRVEVAKRQDEIAKLAKMVVDRVDGALAAIESVDRLLDQAHRKYQEALVKLGHAPGTQNIANPARELARLTNNAARTGSEAMKLPPEE